jgi:signal transduction histidine kinase
MAAAAVGGWVAASFAAVLALMARRSLALRMEAVLRACHELRGPLTAAQLGLELSIRAGEASSARLRAIDLELSRAALALEDLDGARDRGGRESQWELVDVEELLAHSVEAWRPVAEEQRVELRLAWPGECTEIWAERARLAQAVGNLISNAIEHGGGRVEVRSGTSERGLRIEVLDGGPGLPAPVAELARRARAGRGQRGRGLAIASAIAENHGGRLAAGPAERGARLVLELPLRRSDEAVADEGS